MAVPVISVAQMREWEKLTWAAKRTPFEVISRVGHLIAHRVRQLTRPGDSILVLAGKGHNGDDARQVVQNLTDREVTLVNVREPAAGLKEFQSQLSLSHALIVEGLFGIGLKGPLDPDWCRLVDAVNQSRIPIFAIDVPAGLNGDTGEPHGTAVRARWTLTLGAPKRGLLAPAASPFVGRLEVAPDIGLVACPHAGHLLWTVAEDFAFYPPPRPVDGHKGSFGHLVIVAGSRGYHGAAVLAARAAQRAQPGLITLYVPEDIYLPVASQLQAVMVRPWTAAPSWPDTATAVLVGPGLAAPDLPADLRAQVIQRWKESNLAVIADASALDWLPAGKIQGTGLRVVTPHPGEAARLLESTVPAVQLDRPAAVAAIARRYGQAWVVLKGFQTAIGRAKGEVFINSSGDASLAQGGSGDVLAGYLSGLAAQPHLQADPLTLLRYAAWQHGVAADTLSAEHTNWITEDLLPRLGDRRRPVRT